MEQNKKQSLVIIISYLFFGVLTTVVSMVTYFIILWLGEMVFKIPPEDTRFYFIRIVAQILQWVFAVLFAFFTNKKWVFTTADQNVSVIKQLSIFASARLLTLGLDTVVTFGMVELLYALHYKEWAWKFIIEINVNADIIAKIVAAVLVVICNYILSKLLVFKEKKNSPEESK